MLHVTNKECILTGLGKTEYSECPILLSQVWINFYGTMLILKDSNVTNLLRREPILGARVSSGEDLQSKEN